MVSSVGNSASARAGDVGASSLLFQCLNAALTMRSSLMPLCSLNIDLIWRFTPPSMRLLVAGTAPSALRASSR